ncbi:helix-turn-helix domain-containing protein [Pseudomonas sp. GM18]|uniref:helix-turn-helix domain-containing protein n=1 Tax=Pseudomonas sp. GM18 TaxID=1144324 RepID=UPI001EE64221|nr:LysR family transcriptional regulator [Pseudomonas sp. GM18]
MGVTQAAVSGSLKRLRNDYGDRLFTPVGRRMEPTPFCVHIAPRLLASLAMSGRLEAKCRCLIRKVVKRHLPSECATLAKSLGSSPS